MLRERQPSEDEAAAADAAADHDAALVADDRTIADRTTGDGPGTSHDDAVPVGTDTTWGRPATDVGSTAPVAAPVTRRRTFSWGQILILLAGVASLVFGVGAVALGGLAGSVTAPVVQVFTFDHTPLLGLIEIGAGAVLVLAGLVPGGRWVAGPIGVAAIVGGALVIAQLNWTTTKLAAEQRFGWVPIAIGTVAYFGAMVAPKKRVVAAR